MKTILLAAVAVTALALPAFAGEGNGDPFPSYSNGVTTAIGVASQQRADVGANSYPNVTGRPGSALGLDVANIVPDVGSQQPVQTANSLPRGFEQGLPVYAHVSPRLPTLVAGNNAARPRG